MTHVAVASGGWSQSGTWQGGVVPDEGANVLIPEAITVTQSLSEIRAKATARGP